MAKSRKRTWEKLYEQYQNGEKDEEFDKLKEKMENHTLGRDDYEKYNIDRGGFYFDLNKEIPSGVCHTEDEVLDYILNSDYTTECEKAQRFRDRHIEVGGNATKMCVEKILEEGEA